MEFTTGTGQRIKEQGTVIEFMGGEQVYIVVTEQPEEIIKSKSSA
jgi:K+/H+ antiporter YhaU regulatory subunit KhtT